MVERTQHNGIKSATLIKTRSGNYYLSILIQSGEILKKERSLKNIGIILGIKDFIVTSDGQIYENLKLIRIY